MLLKRSRILFVVIVAVLLSSTAIAQTASTLSQETQASIDKAATEALAKTGVPSASVAVVKDGKLAFAKAYGLAQVEPRVEARPDLRYGVGSISKQFTAAAILLLQEQGKLKLDDPVGKYIPNLTRGNEVTIRNLLSHTSGYSDYWPQDYVMPWIMKPTTPEKIMDKWARKPLDFDPGTKWEYSNTNFTIAGEIIQKVSGMPMMDFLMSNIFKPLEMHSVTDIDEVKPNAPTDAVGYRTFALGPPRVAPLEGKGWMFAAGELYMTASDLAKWDISMINQSVMKPESYKEMETEVRLKDGDGTGYGLGVSLGKAMGHRVVSHGGEVSGFVAQNMVFPDDKAAIVVLTNLDASGAASQIAGKIIPLLFPQQDAKADEKLAQTKKIYSDLQQGKIDRSLFTDDANFYFDEQALKDFASSLGPLGQPTSFTAGRVSQRGGMTYRGYTVKYPSRTLSISTYTMPDGKIEQYLVIPRD